MQSVMTFWTEILIRGSCSNDFIQFQIVLENVYTNPSQKFHIVLGIHLEMEILKSGLTMVLQTIQSFVCSQNKHLETRKQNESLRRTVLEIAQRLTHHSREFGEKHCYSEIEKEQFREQPDSYYMTRANGDNTYRRLSNKQS